MGQIYKRELYLKKLRGFYKDNEMIKVITGIKRCGKTFLLRTIIEELKEKGVSDKDIIYIRLDVPPYNNLTLSEQLDNLIKESITDHDFKYLFIDEVQNVKDLEKVIDGYGPLGNMSIFITGSNSYLLSGELVTKLTGRKIEIEVFPLNFYEYIEMKKFFGRDINNNIYLEFENYVRNGGFPGSISYENDEDRRRYTENILDDIFNKDIKVNEKIKSTETFRNIETFIINNFGTMISASSIKKYYKSKNINIDIRTINRYINILENAKIIYPCDTFDIKSKMVLNRERKYYLADTSIYFAFNTDNRINYGPVLENILHNYLLSKDYHLSVGKIGKLECDFIARKGIDNYYYIQVSKNIEDDKTSAREYRPFYEIKDMYPRYLFLLDFIFKKNVDGINNANIVDFMYNNEELK